MSAAELEEKIGYRFEDRALLQRALTHRSWSEEAIGQQSTHEWHNERLEFLGDTVLGLAITQALCQEFLQASEGVLSRARSKLVGTWALVQVGTELELGRYMRIGRGEERSRGREKPRIIANCVEAVLGAVFEDGGYERAMAVVMHLWRPLLEQARAEGIDGYGVDPKSLLQQRTQALWGAVPHYRISAEDGPAHRRRFQAVVTVGEHLQAIGDYASRKQEASRSAARRALLLLAACEE